MTRSAAPPDTPLAARNPILLGLSEEKKWLRGIQDATVQRLLDKESALIWAFAEVEMVRDLILQAPPERVNYLADPREPSC